MKCQKCDEKALFHITDIPDDGEGFNETHLCWRHAQDYIREPSEIASVPGDKAESVASATAPSNRVCPVCKTTFAEFRTSGRLGCAHDYRAFESELRPLLENIHGSSRHIGRSPQHQGAGPNFHVLALRKELQKAVGEENDERAAQLSDEIDQLEDKAQPA
jgi:protein arginine kinase activator